MVTLRKLPSGRWRYKVTSGRRLAIGSSPDQLTAAQTAAGVSFAWLTGQSARPVMIGGSVAAVSPHNKGATL